ncbi:MAG: hypothetical protein CL666_06240 [Balneola sp.]|nr:hypothetical protein [Balneola sp.]|tara:strand:- start:51664 stop:52299 length:636 start_codon:yes stop_codon:yes gene_type:complete
MSKLIAFTSLLLFLFQGIKAQDHLEPSTSLFGLYDFEYEYESQIRDTLLKGLSDSPEVQIVITPSFGKEMVLQLENDRTNQAFTLITQTGSHSIWYNNYEDKPKEIKIKRIEKELLEDDFKLIKDLYKSAIMTVRYPDENIMGLDGTTYQFAVSDYGIKTGQTWSPNEESRMGRLVDITHKLVELSEKRRRSVQLSSELISEINKLIIELQ